MSASSSRQRQQPQCPFCLRHIPPSLVPTPTLLLCCGGWACDKCGPDLLASSSWTCLACFATERPADGKPLEYPASVRSRAERKACPRAMVTCGLLATTEGAALNWWLRAEAAMIGVKDALPLPAHVQYALGCAYEEGYLTTTATAAQARKIAMRYFNNAAGAGSVPAAERMGHFYEHGFDVPKSYTAALGWYGKAAEQGNAKSQFALGRILSSGMGMAEPKPEAAVRWWKLAAEQTGVVGDALAASAAAMVSLGVAYRLGMGVTRNEKEAAFYFQLAADTGVSPEGLFELGECYRCGSGVPKPSVSTAVHFYKKAALHGYDKANHVLISLGLFSTEGKGGVKRYVPRPRSCARCGKHESDFEIDVMIMCRRCNAVGYCSKLCKALHFRDIHQEECGTLTTLNEQFEVEQLSPPSSPRHDPTTWEQFTDHKTGELYWYDHETGISQWEDPESGRRPQTGQARPRGKNYYK